MGWEDKIIDRLWDKGEKYLSANRRKTLPPELANYSLLFGCYWVVGGIALIFIHFLLKSPTLTNEPVLPPSTNVSIPSISSPIARQFSPEEKNDLRNAIRGIQQVSGKMGDALLKSLKEFQTGFTKAFNQSMNENGRMVVPANVSGLIDQLKFLHTDCDAFQQELLEDEKSPAKQYVAYDSELKRILKPEEIITILGNVKARANALNPDLGAITNRSTSFRKVESFIEKNQGSNDIVPLVDVYRNSEIPANEALYAQIKPKVEALSAAEIELSVWLQETKSRSDAFLLEINKN